MGTVTKLTFEEYVKLQDEAEETVRYELDEGELLLTPSPAPYHDIVCNRLRRALTNFVEEKLLGLIFGEIDFRLSANTVRKPDIAFVTQNHLQRIDLDRSPIQGAPGLAVEVISPTNTAQDIAKKTRQYLASGCRSVWIVYPILHMIEVHSNAGIRKIEEPQSLEDDALLPGFRLSLSGLFDKPKT